MQSRRTCRASLRQVTFAESPAGRDHHRPVTSSEPRGDRYIYRGRGRPPCQQRDTLTILLQGVCGRYWTMVEDQHHINHAMEMEDTTSCCRRVLGDGPMLKDDYTTTVHVISLPDS